MFWSSRRIEERITRLRELDAHISDLRQEQSVIVNDLSKMGIAQRDRARSLIEWLCSRLDTSRAHASDLVLARRLAVHRDVSHRLFEREISFDRAMATLKLADAGAEAQTVRSSYRVDLNRVASLTAQQRRVSRVGELQAFAGRFFSIQPTLDESSWRLSGQLPGVEGRVVEKALHDRADEFRTMPKGETSTRGQRQADALVAMAQDSIDRDGDQAGDASGSSVAVFVDFDQANGTGGELGAAVEYGLRVGPNTLNELLCTGSVQIIGLTNGRPVVTSDAAKVIPPAVRRYVAYRDRGCTIDGCTSRYRLQPHHIRERRHGGDHDPDQLTTLCWYHHHVAVHGQGFCIDPISPPHRRRLIRTRIGRDPP